MKKRISSVLLMFAILFGLSVPVSAAPSITLNKTSKVLYAGADRLGYRRVSLSPTLEELTGKVQYSSSNPSVAIVDAAGRVYAQKKGTAIITAAVTKAGRKYRAVCLVNVKDPSIRFGTKELTVKVGQTVKVPVRIIPKSTAVWCAYNEKKVNVSKGKVTGLKAGATYIYAQANGMVKKLKVIITK